MKPNIVGKNVAIKLTKITIFKEKKLIALNFFKIVQFSSYSKLLVLTHYSIY
jgi:hypothetical protein